MGMMTLSAAFMKFAAEQSATMREVRGNIRNLAIFHSSYSCSFRIDPLQRSPLAITSHVFGSISIDYALVTQINQVRVDEKRKT